MSGLKSKQVAIVIPTQKSKLDSDDQLSLAHLKKYLKRYDKYFVIPNSVKPAKLKQQGFRYIKFPNRFFKSRNSYNELLLNREFYKKFANYKYILIYQLDALVFSDELMNWCSKNYDYVASPWFYPIIGTLSNRKGFPKSGGNGGFSLRKIDSIIKVLDNLEKTVKRSTTNRGIKTLWFIWAVLTGKSHKIWLNAPAYNYPFAEDGFWSLEAPKYLTDYKVADFKEALKFGFERFPKKCFKLNGEKLPFGVHAWKKYNKKFWLPYLLKQTI